MHNKGNKPFRSFPPQQKKMPNPEDMVFGLRPVLEAIRAGRELDKLYVEKELRNEVLDEVLATAKERDVHVQFVPVEKLNRLTRKNHQGIVAFVSAVHYAKLENVVMDAFSKGEDPVILVLDEITDVRNFGGISRSAECAGVHAILIPIKGSAQIGSDAMKTSAGALSHIPICKSDSLYHSVKYLKESGLRVVACTEKGDKSLYKTKLSGPLCIVMGSEETGISTDIVKQADDKVYIPLKGKIESLNVSVATGVILFEVLRQQMANEG
jgi:23S rRNA (guanosine2251-2'-O)-methyltransferase